MKLKTHHLLLIVVVLVVAYFLFMRSANPFQATDKSDAPGLLHSTRF